MIDPPVIPYPRAVSNIPIPDRGDLAQLCGYAQACVAFSGNILGEGQGKDNGAGGRLGDGSQHIFNGHVA